VPERIVEPEDDVVREDGETKAEWRAKFDRVMQRAAAQIMADPERAEAWKRSYGARRVG
jgi:hypothetical protein